jgi:hypothetical protein
MSLRLSLFSALAAIAPVLPAAADAPQDSIQISRPSFRISQEATHVIKGGDHIKSTGGLDDAWIEPTSASVDFQAKKNDRLGLEIMLAATYFSAPYHYDVPQNYVRSISVSAPRLDISYLFGDPAKPFLRADAGVFTYKYDEYARNLGEYMFRTWAYPGTIQTGGTYGYVGANFATVTGLKLAQTMGMFSHDLIISVETDLTPVYDLNLTYMARANFGNVFKIGAGVQVARIVNADKYPQMKIPYFEHNNVWYIGGAAGSAYYSNLTKGIEEELARPGADSARLNAEHAAALLATAVLDSVSTEQVKPSFKQLTARAIKPVAHFSFDPKPLIGSGIFGAKDLVLYGETAVLGVQNHPVFYEELGRRIPVMAGFNLPAFKALDVLSVEMEYYRNRWLPTYPSSVELNASPAPYMAVASYYPTRWDKDNFKWSVYAERGILNGITLSAQVASDHARSWDWNSYGKTSWEIYTTPSQWYWGLKLSAGI